MSNIAALIYRTFKAFVVKNRRGVVVVLHLLQAVAANYLAFLFRFEFVPPPGDLGEFILYLPLLLAIRAVFYLWAGLNKNMWRYSSVNDLVKIVKTVTKGSIVFAVTVMYIYGDATYPRSVYFMDWMLLIMLSGGSRLTIRIFREYMLSEHTGKRTLIIGAGDAGEMIVRDMKQNPKSTYEPIGFIDDDPSKKNLSIHGVPVLGPRSVLRKIIGKYKPDVLLISMPSASFKTSREIYEVCKPFNIPIKTLPGLRDILDGKVSVSAIKPLSLEDLLQREPIRTDIESVREHIAGKSVLITGAGGSIGSELCRQVISYAPSNLILFDRYENGLFEIDNELKKLYVDNPGVRRRHETIISTIVGDMRDTDTLEYMFSRHRPGVVFHAAAHKHVPLMEYNPIEAVKNNVFGTKNLVETASKHKVESFVMISTDKAVNPTNIMGATKRIAEFITLGMGRGASTKFTIVRFGNVLGSNGSVVRIFGEQLKRGGPLTVTHPEIKRFFMLIPEAVQLVLTAGAAGRGGEIFVLDMGEQIRIVDLAENLIRLSGFVPHEDIQIKFTGLRPGEKLFEELVEESEIVLSTSYAKLKVAVPTKVPSSVELSRHISTLEYIASSNSYEELVSEIRRIVPNFISQHWQDLSKSRVA